MNYLTVPEEIRREVEILPPQPVTSVPSAPVDSLVARTKSSHSKHLTRASRSSLKSKPSQSSSRIQPSLSWELDRHTRTKKARVQRAHKKQMATDELFQKCCGKILESLLHIQAMLAIMVESFFFEIFIFSVVFFNTMVLVVQTFAEVEVWGEWYFIALDSIFLAIYFMEAVLKIMVLGLSYFDYWNSLDFFIMLMAVGDFVLKQIYFSSAKRVAHSRTLFRILKIFKSLRSLRAIMLLRRLSFLSSLQEVTETLARSLPSIGAILVLMFTCLFFFSVILRALFNSSDPKRFQNIFTTIFTLFTMLTLDDWSLIYLDSREKGAWYIIPILMIYIIIQNFIFLNGSKNPCQSCWRRAGGPGSPRAGGMGSAQLRAAVPFSPRQQEKMFHYLRLMVAVEHYQQAFRSQAAVVDEIIDTVFQVGEEDFKK
ncbi:cation channel sperm-associated protein 1 [Petaurus breviceps papuanus]|uniref:cation channel sperm-associated protein 1 n=1 Tax=Petaurus breviceps papuanus TaxID=3040969 RepID=UPI0036D96E53